jgi:hypothetical protein
LKRPGDPEVRVAVAHRPTLVQRKHLDPAGSWRVWSSIDNHVVYGSAGTAHAFCFAMPRPTVHAAEYLSLGPRLGILGERCWIETVRSCSLSVEGGRIETPLVTMGLRNEDEDASNSGRADLHSAIVARRCLPDGVDHGTSCRVCRGWSGDVVLHLGDQPACDFPARDDRVPACDAGCQHPVISVSELVATRAVSTLLFLLDLLTELQ